MMIIQLMVMDEAAAANHVAFGKVILNFGLEQMGLVCIVVIMINLHFVLKKIIGMEF